MKNSKNNLIHFSLLLITVASFFAGLLVTNDDSNNVKALYVLSNRFGANNYLMLDDLENNGWDITFAGTSRIMHPCPGASSVFGAIPIEVDLVIDDNIDVTQFDCIIIGPASWRYGDAYGDLMESETALQLFRNAADFGKVVYATCAGVRVLAQANILNGIHVTGRSEFSSEFTAAGAIFDGTGILPVIDGNIVTTSRGLYFHLQNSQAIATAIENQNPGIIITGGSSDLITVDAEDDKSLWSKVIGGSDSEGFRSICAIGNNEYILTGFTFSKGNGNSDLLICKIDSAGNFIWNKAFGTAGWEYGNSVCSTSDGGFVVTGYKSSDDTHSKDVYVVKFDANGDEVWNKIIGGENIDVGMSICETSDNCYVICGYTESFGAGRDDVYLVKLSENGGIVWTKTFGGGMSDRGNYVINTENGNLALIGSTGSFGTGNRDVYFLKLDLEGNIVIEKTYHDSNYDAGKSLCQTSDGGYVIAGCSDLYESEPMDMYLRKIDAVGNQIWKRKFREGQFYDYGTSVTQTVDGGFIVCGTSKFYETLNDIYIVKTDMNGIIEYKELFGGNGFEWGNIILPTIGGNFLVAGQSNSYLDNSLNAMVFKKSGMHPNFNFDKNTGNAPIEIEFSDNSVGPVITWNWDFDDDGIFESQEKNPTWSFDEPGIYNPVLEISDGKYSLKSKSEIVIKIFNGETSLEFNGTDNLSYIPANSSLNLTDNFTLEFVINPNEFKNGSTGLTLLNKNSLIVSLIERGFGATNNESVKLQMKHTDGSNSVISTPDNSIITDQWTNIAITYDVVPSEVKIYFNGVEQELSIGSSKHPSGSLLENVSEQLSIGNDLDLRRGFKGCFDELRIWNIARSSEQIHSWYDKYLSGSEEGLVGYWKMNEGNGLQLIDEMGNMNGINSNSYYEEGVILSDLTDINDSEKSFKKIPNVINLDQNFPNPFNPLTTFSFTLPRAINSELKSVPVKLIVFDSAGREIKIMVNKNLRPGNYSVNFDASQFASGVYYYRLSVSGFNHTEDFVETKKMILLK